MFKPHPPPARLLSFWLLSLSACLLLAACASSTPVRLATGMQAYQIDCRFSPNGLSACYETAGQVCGARGFTLYDWAGTPMRAPLPAPDDMAILGGLTADRILVACRS